MTTTITSASGSSAQFPSPESNFYKVLQEESCYFEAMTVSLWHVGWFCRRRSAMYTDIQAPWLVINSEELPH